MHGVIAQFVTRSYQIGKNLLVSGNLRPDDEKGRLGSGLADYPLHRRRDDPDFATQSHADHMTALASACKKALKDADVPGKAVRRTENLGCLPIEILRP